METKFHLLSVGQHFEWEGKQYVKSTPLIANQLPEGGQKFMPKAAMVKVVGAAPAAQATTTAPTRLDTTQVRLAVERYHRRCLEISSQQRQEDRLIEEVRSELEQVYRDLLDELKI